MSVVRHKAFLLLMAQSSPLIAFFGGQVGAVKQWLETAGFAAGSQTRAQLLVNAAAAAAAQQGVQVYGVIFHAVPNGNETGVTFDFQIFASQDRQSVKQPTAAAGAGAGAGQ